MSDITSRRVYRLGPGEGNHAATAPPRRQACAHTGTELVHGLYPKTEK